MRKATRTDMLRAMRMNATRLIPSEQWGEFVAFTEGINARIKARQAARTVYPAIMQGPWLKKLRSMWHLAHGRRADDAGEPTIEQLAEYACKKLDEPFMVSSYRGVARGSGNAD